MNFRRFFARPQSAPAARERLKVLLAHERAAVGGSDLVAKLREDILRVISKHMQIDDDKVTVRMERGQQVSDAGRRYRDPLRSRKKRRPDGRLVLVEPGRSGAIRSGFFAQ